MARSSIQSSEAKAPLEKPTLGLRLAAVGLLPRSIHVRAMLSVTLLVVMTVALTAFVMLQRVSRYAQENVVADTQLKAQTLSLVLRGPVTFSDTERMNAALLRATEDPQLVFAAVWRPGEDGALLAHVGDVRLWEAVRPRWSDAGVEEIAGDSAPVRLEIPGSPTGALCTVPIRGLGEREKIKAVLTIAMRNPGTGPMLGQLRHFAVASALLGPLVVAPIVVLLVSSLTRPLRRLANAATHLAGGGRPTPLAETGPLEIASLSAQFNAMAGALAVAHEALLRSNSELEQTVEERTKQLRRMNDALESQIRERNNFVRIVSHDLGAPLRNIAGMTQILIERHQCELSEDAMRRLERIAANVELEVSMLEDLLDLSRLSGGEGRSQMVDCDRLARELERIFEHELREFRVNLVIQSPLPVVMSEPIRLRAVVQNLVDNAIKYMGDSLVREVVISVEAAPEGVWLSVEDTGPGVPEADRERIFELFRRGSTSRSAPPGRGVGLAAVRMIVEGWSGKLTLTPGARGGSRFSVLLPGEPGEPLAQGTATQGESDPKGADDRTM